MIRDNKVKVSFRSKRGSRGAVKVYASVRVPGRRYPLQVHLGYLSSWTTIGLKDRQKIEERLRQKWIELFEQPDVELDWADAEIKWKNRGEQKRAAVDRDTASKQIREWMVHDDERVIPAFSGDKASGEPQHDDTHRDPQQLNVSRQDFIEAFLTELPKSIAATLHGAGGEMEVGEWWTNLEAPRLLWAYFRHARNSKRRFNRGGFLNYLYHNVQQRFAAINYLRACGRQGHHIYVDPSNWPDRKAIWPTDQEV